MAAEGDKQPDAHQHTLRISSRFGRHLHEQILGSAVATRSKMKAECRVLPNKYLHDRSTNPKKTTVFTRMNSVYKRIQNRCTYALLYLSKSTPKKSAAEQDFQIRKKLKKKEENFPEHLCVASIIKINISR